MMRIFWCGIFCAALVACGPSHPAPTHPKNGANAGTLLTPNYAPYDFFWRQRITALHQGKRWSFSAVVEKQRNTLTVVGLTPYGSRAFVITQRGTAVNFQSFMNQPLSFPPKYILLDIQRAFFLKNPQSKADGWHKEEFSRDENLQELWRRARLYERIITCTHQKKLSSVRIRYDGGFSPPQPPARTILHHSGFDYQLIIDTL